MALFRPLFGRQSDRGHGLTVLALGFICLGGGVFLVPLGGNNVLLCTAAIFLGLGQAMVKPSLIARCAATVPAFNIVRRSLSAVIFVNNAHELDRKKDRRIKARTKAGTLQILPDLSV